jgi:hypothetical protein
MTMNKSSTNESWHISQFRSINVPEHAKW